MKLKFFSALMIGAMFISACTKDGSEGPVDNGGTTTPIVDPNVIDLPNGNFENDLEGWTIKAYANGDKTTVEIVEGQGVKGSKCLKIQQLPENKKCCVGVTRQLTGLEPDQMYRLSARIRYSDITKNEGTGPVIFSPNNKQYWNSSKYLYGTELKDWTNVTVDFMTDDNGCATIVAALGYYQGGMQNGGHSTGTAYFDNISLKKVSSELYNLESEHMRIFWESSKVVVGADILNRWIYDVDKMYEAMAELMGERPHEGRKLAIQTTRGMYSGYWALAGYPILWNANSDAVETTLNQIKQYGEMSFGLMHEMGHVFNMGNTSWNWNDEMFANFRMHYALAKSGLKVCQTDENGDFHVYEGADILNLYRVSYEKTVQSTVNDNGIHYMLARMSDQIGWEPYKKTFDYLHRQGFTGSSNKYDKFVNFVNVLSKYATECDPQGRTIDLMDTFSTMELSSIKRKLQ